jgi:hypothetical protein
MGVASMIAVIFWCLFMIGLGVLMALFASWFLTRRPDRWFEDHFKSKWW